MKIKFILGVSLLTSIIAAVLIASTTTYLNANAQNTTTQQTPPQQLQQNQTMSGQSSITNDTGPDEGAGEDQNEAGDNDTNDKEDSP